ncbi:hypothetical protein BC829DRAFT_437376, partial [Chytridium lagenaria]
MISSFSMVAMTVSSEFMISICVQASRFYAENVLVTTILFAVFSMSQSIFFFLMAKGHARTKEEEELHYKALEKFAIPLCVLFSIPIKILRYIQVTRSPFYKFWPVLFIFQVLDRALPRFLLSRHSSNKLNYVDPVLDDVELLQRKDDLDPSCDLPPLSELLSGHIGTQIGGLRQQIHALDVDDARSYGSTDAIGNSNSRDIVHFSTASEKDLRRHSTLSPPKQIHTQPNASRQNTITTTPKALARSATTIHIIRTTEKVVKELLAEVQNSTSPSFLPHDLLRKSQCIGEYNSILISLGLVCLSPGDFFAVSEEGARSARDQFYGRSSFDGGFRHDAIGSYDLSKGFKQRPWLAVIFVAIVSMVFSGIIERAIVMWETYKGLSRYDANFKYQFITNVYIVLGLSMPLFYIFAGCRGLWSYGPLKFQMNAVE